MAHQTTHRLVSHSEHEVFILEDLATSKMTRRPKAKKDVKGRWQRNGARAKAGLNRSILASSWSLFALLLTYKSHRAKKSVFKISAYQTSQECAVCAHIDPDNRKTRSEFRCVACGHRDHADRNAAMVIKKRGIHLILDSGTELSDRGVLRPGTGRGAASKTPRGKTSRRTRRRTVKNEDPGPKLASEAIPTDVSPKLASEATPL